jgi:hypothetical protein
VLPAVIAIYENHLPNVAPLVRVLPSGVLKVVTMLVVGKLCSELLTAHVDPGRAVALGFVLLALPGVLLSLLGNVGRDGKEWETTWPTRVFGTGVVAFGVLLVLGVVTI